MNACCGQAHLSVGFPPDLAHSAKRSLAQHTQNLIVLHGFGSRSVCALPKAVLQLFVRAQTVNFFQGAWDWLSKLLTNRTKQRRTAAASRNAAAFASPPRSARCYSRVFDCSTRLPVRLRLFCQLTASCSLQLRSCAAHALRTHTTRAAAKQRWWCSLAHYALQTTATEGQFGTVEFRMYMRKKDATVSPWHDIPLFVDRERGIVNFVAEIPRG